MSANPVTVCTIDQLFTFVYRALGTEIFAATLKYSKLIIDEIQSYDPRSIATILYGLKTIQQMGGRYSIISASVPPSEILRSKRIGRSLFVCRLYRRSDASSS